MRADLLDAQAAIDWAVEQIPMLKKRIGDWADSYSTRIAIEDGKKAYYLRANPVPAIINAETGSIINSIRTSLDLLASALAARNGNAGSRQVYFPVCGTQAQFLKDGKGKIKLLSPADQAVIETLQPYNVGDGLLSALHELDILRKHRQLVAVQPFARGLGIEPTDGSFVHYDYNPAWRDFGDATPVLWTDAGASDCKVRLGGVYVAINEPGAAYGQQAIVVLPKFVTMAASIIGGQRILEGFQPSGSAAVRDVVAIALLMRTLSNFQGTILMAERGMVVEAGALARCCFENAVFVGALRNEGDKFLAEVQMTDRYSVKTMARWLVQVPDRLQHAPQGAKRRLEGLINEIRQQIPGFERAEFKALAGRAGLDDAYVHYAVLSRDAAHPSAQSLDRYFIRGRGKFPLQGMRWGAYASEPDEIPLTLNMASLATLEVCESMCEMLSNTDAKRGQSTSFCAR